MATDEQSESWLLANGWRRVQIGSMAMWTHDYLVREGGKVLLTFGAAIEHQRKWEERR